MHTTSWKSVKKRRQAMQGRMMADFWGGGDFNAVEGGCADVGVDGVRREWLA